MAVFCQKPILVHFPEAKANQVKTVSLLHGTMFFEGKEQQIVCVKDFILCHLPVAIVNATNKFKRVSKIAPHTTVSVNNKSLKVKFIVPLEAKHCQQSSQSLAFVTGAEIHRYFHRAFSSTKLKGFNYEDLSTLATALLKPAPHATSGSSSSPANPMDDFLPELNNLNDVNAINLTECFVRIKRGNSKPHVIKNVKIPKRTSKKTQSKAPKGKLSKRRSASSFTATDSDSDEHAHSESHPIEPASMSVASASTASHSHAGLEQKMSSAAFGSSQFVPPPITLPDGGVLIPIPFPPFPMTASTPVEAKTNPAKTTLPHPLPGHTPTFFLPLPPKPTPTHPTSVSQSTDLKKSFSPAFFPAHQPTPMSISSQAQSTFTSTPPRHVTSRHAAFALTRKRPADEAPDDTTALKKGRPST